MEELSVLHENADRCVELLQDDPESFSTRRTSAIAVAQTILRHVVILARRFDGSEAGDTVRYCANIMVVVNRKDIENHRKKGIEVKFVTDRENYDGAPQFLVLHRQLSCTCTCPKCGGENPTEKCAGDSRTMEYALPIPSTPRTEYGLWRALPGAPWAASNRSITFCEDTRKIRGMMDSSRGSGNFAPDVIERVATFYASQREFMTGFISIPIFSPAGEADELRSVVGVLNIYWNGANRLQVPESCKLFAEALFPMRLLLTKLLMSETLRKYSTNPPPPEEKK